MPEALSNRQRSAASGVEIAATAHYLPRDTITNADLESRMDTSDEWITTRTGVKSRHVASADETVTVMASAALARAMDRASVRSDELDMLVLASVGAEMSCPSSACVVLDRINTVHGLGSTNAAAFDLTAACSGFVYGLNLAEAMLRSGPYRTIAVVGAEHLTATVEYTTRGRGTAIIFGDGAGAAIVRRSEDATKGLIAQAMHSDGSRWRDLFIPRVEPRDFPDHERAADDELPIGLMRMNGRSVFRFAVETFGDVIQQTLDAAGMTADDVDHFVCHQSNVRILKAARERFGLPEEKLAVNIDRVGNTSAASVPILFDELREAGTVRHGQRVMFVAFGGGLTWASSLWQL